MCLGRRAGRMKVERVSEYGHAQAGRGFLSERQDGVSLGIRIGRVGRRGSIG